MADDGLTRLKKICSEIENKCLDLLKIAGNSNSNQIKRAVEQIDVLNKESASLINSKLPGDDTTDVTIESKLNDINESQFDEMLDEISKQISSKVLSHNPEFSNILDKAVALTTQLYDKDGNFGTFSNQVGSINKIQSIKSNNKNIYKAKVDNNNGKTSSKRPSIEASRQIGRDKEDQEEKEEEKKTVNNSIKYEFKDVSTSIKGVHEAIDNNNLEKLKAILKNVPLKEKYLMFEGSYSTKMIEKCVSKDRMDALKIICDIEYSDRALYFDKKHNELYSRNGRVFSIIYRYCYLHLNRFKHSNILMDLANRKLRMAEKKQDDLQVMTDYFDWWFEVLKETYNLMVEFNDFDDIKHKYDENGINGNVFDVLMLFLKIQTRQRKIEDWESKRLYFYGYHMVLFKSLLNLAFNENDFYQKLLKNHNNNNSNNTNVFKNVFDINKMQGFGGNYLIHYIILCCEVTSRYLREFGKFIENKKNTSKNNEYVDFTINCQLLNDDNESIFHILSKMKFQDFDKVKAALYLLCPIKDYDRDDTENFAQLYNMNDYNISKKVLYARSYRDGGTPLSNLMKYSRLHDFLLNEHLRPFLYAICKFDSNILRVDNNDINSRSLFDEVFSSIGCENYKGKIEEAFIKHLLSNCDDLLNEIVYYRDYDGYNILSYIIDGKHFDLVKYALQKLFYFQDIGINGVKTKLSEMLEYKIGVKKDCNCLMFASWQKEQICDFVKSVYNASKNDEIATL